MTVSVGRESGLGTTLRQLIAAGSFAEALVYYLDRASALPGPEFRSLAAGAAARVGEYDLAETLAEGALSDFEARNDLAGQVQALNFLGGIAFERGRLDHAERAFRRGVRLATALDDGSADLAKLWNNLGSVVHLRGNDELAVTFYRNALQIHRAHRDDRGIAQTNHNLAVRLAASGELDDAWEHAILAVAHARMLADPGLLGLVTIGRAERALTRSDWDAAEVDVTDGLDLAIEARDHLGVAEALRLKAVLALRRGSPEAARLHAEAAYTQASELGAMLTAVECEALIAVAEKKLARAVEAESRYLDVTAKFRKLGAEQPLQAFLHAWAAA